MYAQQRSVSGEAIIIAVESAGGWALLKHAWQLLVLVVFHSQVKHDDKLAGKLQELVTPNAADEVGVRIQPANYCRIGGALTRYVGKSRSGLDS